MKNEKIGSISSGTVILLLVVISYIFMIQYTGFIFNTRNLNNINFLTEMAGIVIPLILWCIVNWALTTFMDGKGKLRDVYIASTYALTPIIIILVPVTVISNYLVETEAFLYEGFLGLALIWSLTLLITGTITIHEYDLRTTLVTLIFCIIGIGLVLFIGLLFFSLLDLVQGFIRDIYREIIFRV